MPSPTNNDKRTYIRWRNTTAGVDAVPANTLYYFLRQIGGSCDVDDAAFYALSITQKVALSTTTKPDSANGWIEQACSGKGSTKLKELYIGRNPDGTLSFYADGTGTLKISLIAAAGTAAYPNGLKTMTTSDGPYPRDGLFTGSKPYGSYFLAVPNGNYVVQWIDEDDAFLSFSITLTKTAPFTWLKLASGGTAPIPTPTPTPSPTPTPTPTPDQNYDTKGVLGGYLTA